MLLLKRKTFEIETAGPVVSADEAATVASAQEIVAAAEAEATRIHAEALKDAEAERQKGYQAGLDEGRMEIAMQKLDLVEESMQFMESVEDKMTDIVLKALRKCVAQIDDRELVAQIVRKSMQAVVRNQRQITIKVNPSMAASVRTRLQEILADFPSVAQSEVVEDEHLAPTACVVETEAGVVEASIEGQLQAIEKSVRKAFAKEG